MGEGMRTPEEIKKGLECCIAIRNGKCEEYEYCACCPFYTTSATDADTLAYIRQLETQVPKWISVEDPPKKSGRYLIMFEDGHCCDAEYDECIDFDSQFGEYVSIFDSHTLGFVDSEWRGYQEVTHWMPLPEPPKEG